ncbi:glutamate racemase [Sulfoacidibacillus ferrooxidans]|uniref:Glutamate racemase n=1 Tax=Sulfoacidibacillus ferrooxidans TaxID=2005001 RepID=A0A9X2ADB5_9BACL|nr:glutamate racemase [Sulfoacidibacillus ferrooxidans]MCI0183220.1 Glutamate racemase [Sulfoacidibacillus ferrooxidans]
MLMRNAPIGVMDSGVGGLTVVGEIWRQLPREEVLFYGDSLRCPYGDRTVEEIATYTFQALDYLVSQGVKMLVIACNTATAICLEPARKRYTIPVIGVIAPGSRAAIAATLNHKVGIIGTSATIRSGSYPKALHATHRGIETYSLACPPFVELVESGVTEEVALPIVRATLEPIVNTDMDTLILGCTHYPLLSKLIQEVVGPDVCLINSAEQTARDVSFWLDEQHLTRIDLRDPHHVFLTSGEAHAFAQIGQNWLGCPLDVRYLDVWHMDNEATRIEM